MSDDETIDRYRAEMSAEAELARGDLDEIEDHIRALAAELREHGVPPAEAIALACRRLGDPRQIAREHARVRSPFGPQLSRMRAWSAAALLGAPALWALPREIESPHAPAMLVACVIAWLGVIAALALRWRWARPVALGFVASNCLFALPRAIMFGQLDVYMVALAGAIAFLVPWRRGEITRAGAALVLLGPAYDAASRGVIMFGSHAFVANPCGVLALGLVVVAAAGVVLRRRWAIASALAAAIALFAFQWSRYHELFGSYPMRMDSLWRTLEVANLVLGTACACVAAFVARLPRVRALRMPAV